MSDLYTIRIPIWEYSFEDSFIERYRFDTGVLDFFVSRHYVENKWTDWGWRVYLCDRHVGGADYCADPHAGMQACEEHWVAWLKKYLKPAAQPTASEGGES